MQIERWWLTEGDGNCCLCRQRYALELGHRCPSCDGPVCCHCAVVVETECFCVECAECPEEKED